MLRWPCSNAKAGPWSMEEIEQLIDAMEHIPYGKWSRVQQERNFHHRSQVGLRFAHQAASLLPCWRRSSAVKATCMSCSELCVGWGTVQHMQARLAASLLVLPAIWRI